MYQASTDPKKSIKKIWVILNLKIEFYFNQVENGFVWMKHQWNCRRQKDLSVNINLLLHCVDCEHESDLITFKNKNCKFMDVYTTLLNKKLHVQLDLQVFWFHVNTIIQEKINKNNWIKGKFNYIHGCQFLLFHVIMICIHYRNETFVYF